MKKKITAKKTTKKAAPRSSYHATGILLEHIQHQVEIIAEGVDANNQKIDVLDKKIDSVKDDLQEQIQTVAKQLNNKLETVKDDLQEQIQTVAKQLNNKLETVKEVLSGKVDAIATRLDRHDAEIEHLKETQHLS